MLTTKTLLCASLSIALSLPAWARVTVEKENSKYLTMKVTNNYVLGDNDTVTQAQDLLLEQLKKEASDYAGQYVESELKISNNKIVEQQIRILTAGYMEVLKIENSRKINQSGSIELYGKAKIRVSKESIRDGLEKLKRDPERKAQISKLETENDILRNELIKLSESINNESRIDLMNERKTVLSRLNTNRDAAKAVFEKGGLLELANIGKKEYELAIEDIEQNVFDYFKYNTKVTLGQLGFTVNKNGTYNVFVPVKWSLKGQPVKDVLDQYFNFKKKSVGEILIIYPYLNMSGELKKPYSEDLNDYMEKKIIAIEVSVGQKKGYLPIVALNDAWNWNRRGYSFHFYNNSNEKLLSKSSNPIIIKNVSKEILRNATSISSSVIVIPKENLRNWGYD